MHVLSPPQGQMNVTNVNKHCQPRWNVAFIISKLNVPSLQNSHRGFKTNVSVCNLWSLASSKRQMLHKHANWIFFWWIGVIRLGWKLAVFWHSMGPVEFYSLKNNCTAAVSARYLMQTYVVSEFDIISMHDRHDMRYAYAMWHSFFPSSWKSKHSTGICGSTWINLFSFSTF